MHITGSKTITTDETYQLVVGKASKVHDHYNALQLELEEIQPRQKIDNRSKGV
jgi:hypothetical protein